jgi:hypothetical protein
MDADPISRCPRCYITGGLCGRPVYKARPGVYRVVRLHGTAVLHCFVLATGYAACGTALPCPALSITLSTLHSTPLYCLTLHYTVLHYTPLHPTPPHYTTLYYSALHYTVLPYLHPRLQVVYKGLLGTLSRITKEEGFAALFRCEPFCTVARNDSAST